MQRMDIAEIESRLRAIFPELDVFAPTDREYVTVDLIAIERLAAINPPPPWYKNINECEEIARRFVVQVRDWELATIASRPEELRCNMLVGVAHGDRFQGEAKDHTVNIIMTDAEIHLLDMQTGRRWPALPGRDNVFMVEL